MSKRTILMMAVIWLAACGPATAAVTVYTDEASFLTATGSPQYLIDFETFGDGSTVVGDPIVDGTEWSDLGVQFSPAPPSDVLQLTDSGNTVTSGTHALFSPSPFDHSNYVITFSTPVESVGFWLIDSELTDPVEELVLYDASDNPLLSMTPPFLGYITTGPESNYFLGYTSDTPISKIALIEHANDDDGVGFDDFRYTVPEPTSIGLMGLGGLALLRRRKNHA